MNIENYNQIRNGGFGFHRQKRGLIEISGSEAVQFLDGLITNDMKTLEDGEDMLAAFPNSKGRLLAIVGILRRGDKFLIETEEATYEKIFQNLFRFTFAGDFVVEDLTEKYVSYWYFGLKPLPYEDSMECFNIGEQTFVRTELAEIVEKDELANNLIEISDETYEVLRIEEGISKYGVDMDEETVVPEVGLAELISYNKGCYIGQEVIARIHFRGKVAKELKGLIFEDESPQLNSGDELKSLDDKNAGFITSVTFSPKLNKTIALGYVRNSFLGEGTELKVNNFTAQVKNLPFIE